MGSPATSPKDGTLKSKFLPRGKTSNSKDLEENKQPADKGFPFTFDEGIRKLKPLPKGKATDAKEPQGNIQPASIGSHATHPDEDSDDELKEISDDEVFESRVAEDNWEKHKKATASYADLKMEIARFHAATYKANENTNTAMRNYEKIIAQFKAQNVEGISRVLNNLKEVQDAVNEDHTLNKKVLDAAEAYTKNLSNLTELLNLSSANIATISPFVPNLKPSPERKDEEKKEIPSHTEGEKTDMVTGEHKEEKAKSLKYQHNQFLKLVDIEYLYYLISQSNDKELERK
ncbi:hypothetical protein Tco_0660509 [Tanacetum coccineum]